MAVITLTVADPAYKGLNKWPHGNSWEMLEPFYQDLVNLNNGASSLAGNNIFAGQFSTSSGVVSNRTAVPINTTGAGTLAVVSSGVKAGLISSTSAAGVTVTLDSVANTIAAVGGGIGVGSYLEFIIDNSQGASTVTLAVDSGATWAVATPAITGGATLTVSTANKLGRFQLYITSATTGIVSRMI